MYRGMNEYEIGIARLQSFHRPRTTMGRTIINNPKDTPCCGIGRLTHNVVNKAIKGGNAASAFASTEQFSATNINGSDIGPSATSGVFMLHLHRRARLGRIGSMTTTTRLDAGFFIGRQDKLVILKSMPIPYPCRRDPGFSRLSRQIEDHGEISRNDTARDEWHPHEAIAIWCCH